MPRYGIADPRHTDDERWQIRWRDPQTNRIRRRTFATREAADRYSADLLHRRTSELRQLQRRHRDLVNMLTRAVGEQDALSTALRITQLDVRSGIGQLIRSTVDDLSAIEHATPPG